MNIIRKISVGPDYKNSMHYSVGQEVLDRSYSIYDITKDNDGHKVWIIKLGEIVLWKTFSQNMPVSVEYKIDF